jgi:hypothetical protein
LGPAPLVQVDLLTPEPKGRVALSEGHDLHPENVSIEAAGRLDAGHREHEMVDASEPHPSS